MPDEDSLIYDLTTLVENAANRYYQAEKKLFLNKPSGTNRAAALVESIENKSVAGIVQLIVEHLRVTNMRFRDGSFARFLLDSLNDHFKLVDKKFLLNQSARKQIREEFCRNFIYEVLPELSGYLPPSPSSLSSKLTQALGDELKDYMNPANFFKNKDMRFFCKEIDYLSDEMENLWCQCVEQHPELKDCNELSEVLRVLAINANPNRDKDLEYVISLIDRVLVEGSVLLVSKNLELISDFRNIVAGLKSEAVNQGDEFLSDLLEEINLNRWLNEFSYHRNVKKSVLMVYLIKCSLQVIKNKLETGDDDFSALKENREFLSAILCLSRLMMSESMTFIPVVVDPYSKKIAELVLHFYTQYESKALNFSFLVKVATSLGFNHRYAQAMRLMKLRLELYDALVLPSEQQEKLDKLYDLLDKSGNKFRTAERMRFFQDSHQQEVQQKIFSRNYDIVVVELLKLIPGLNSMKDLTVDREVPIEEVKLSGYAVKSMGDALLPLVEPRCYMDLLKSLIQTEKKVNLNRLKYGMPKKELIFNRVNQLVDRSQVEKLRNDFSDLLQKFVKWSNNYLKKNKASEDKKTLIARIEETVQKIIDDGGRLAMVNLLSLLRQFNLAIEEHLLILYHKRISSGRVGEKLFEATDQLLSLFNQISLENAPELLDELLAYQHDLNSYEKSVNKSPDSSPELTLRRQKI